MRGAGLIVLASLLGCRPPDVALYLPQDPDTHAALIAARRANEVTLTAVDLSEADPTEAIVLPSYIGSYDVELTVLLYKTPLAAMRLSPGPIGVVETGRPLPPSTKTYQAIVRGQSVTGWEAMDAIPPTLRDVRLNGPDDLACVVAGGCFEEGVCAPLCSMVDEPAPPIPTTSPQTEPCPAGATPRTLRDDVVVCELFGTGREQTCPRAQAHFVGGTGCERIGPACPVGAYADDPPPGPRVYVAPGGTGDGTLASPFGDIQDAIGAAQVGGVVLLAKGRYTESFTIRSGVTVVGACVADTTVAAPGERVSLEGTSALLNLRLEGAGVKADRGPATIRLANLDIRQPEVNAIYLSGAITADLDSIVIEDPSSDGLGVWNGPVVTARRVIIRKANSHGVILHNANLTLDEAVIEENEINATNVSRAIGVQGSATLLVRRSAFINNTSLAVFVDSSDATFEDVVIRDTRPTANDVDDGGGMLVQNEAVVRLRRSWMHQNRDAHIANFAHVELEDSVLSAALPKVTSEDGGYGIRANSQATTKLTRSVIDDTAYHAISTGAGLTTLIDVQIFRTGVRGIDGREGRAIYAVGPIFARRLDISSVAGGAIDLRDGATADLEDVRITQPGTAGCQPCTGICLNDNATVVATRVEVSGATGSSIGHYGNLAGAMTLSDIHVSGSVVASCDRPATSPSLGLGDGINSRGPLLLERFLITQNMNAGLVLGIDGPVDQVVVHDGTISSNRVGLSLLFETSDLARLTTRVRIVDNVVGIGAE